MSIDEIEGCTVFVSDPEVNVQFWCVCLAENATAYQALFKAKRTIKV